VLRVAVTSAIAGGVAANDEVDAASGMERRPGERGGEHRDGNHGGGKCSGSNCQRVQRLVQ
jgi:hypothetical protein